jgi:predicted esterase
LDYNQQSLHHVREYIHKQIDLLMNMYENVILIGYSQGASVALDAALTCSHSCIAVVSISGILLRDFVVRPGESYSRKQHPIYVAHGISDDEIPFALASSSFRDTMVTRRCHFSGTHWEFWSNAYFSNFILNSLEEILVVNS